MQHEGLHDLGQEHAIPCLVRLQSIIHRQRLCLINEKQRCLILRTKTISLGSSALAPARRAYDGLQSLLAVSYAAWYTSSFDGSAFSGMSRVVTAAAASPRPLVVR